MTPKSLLSGVSHSKVWEVISFSGWEGERWVNDMVYFPESAATER